MTVTIHVGEAREVLRSLPAESVHCVVTSPPYWGLRAYGGDPGMIGLEKTFEEHLENLVAVFREVWRVLRKDGVLWLNYGDCYTASGRGAGSLNSKQRTNVGSHMPSTRGWTDLGLKPKDLMMMPARVAMALQEAGAADVKALRVLESVHAAILNEYDLDVEGIPDKVMAVLERLEAEYAEAKGDSWWLRSEIIWAKPNPMPESTKDRPTSSHEKMFLLAKAPRYFYDAEAVKTEVSEVKERTWTPGGWGTSKYYRGQDAREPDRRGQLRYQPGERGVLSANLRNVWPISTMPYKEAHFATFPVKLVEPCIKAGTSHHGCCATCGAPWVRRMTDPKGGATGKSWHSHADDLGTGNASQTGQRQWDSYTPAETTGWVPSCDCKQEAFGAPYPVVPATVLDPFGGSGTVGLVADQLGRNAVIIEINEDYAAMARKRIHGDAPLLAEVS